MLYQPYLSYSQKSTTPFPPGSTRSIKDRNVFLEFDLLWECHQSLEEAKIPIIYMTDSEKVQYILVFVLFRKDDNGEFFSLMKIFLSTSRGRNFDLFYSKAVEHQLNI